MEGTPLKETLTKMFNLRRRDLPKLQMLSLIVGEMHTNSTLPMKYKNRNNKTFGLTKKLQNIDLEEIKLSFANASPRYFAVHAGLFNTMVLSEKLRSIIAAINTPAARANLITPSSKKGQSESCDGINYLVQALALPCPSPHAASLSVASFQSPEGTVAGTESGKETNTETRGESETGTGMKGQGGGQGQITEEQSLNAYLGGLNETDRSQHLIVASFQSPEGTVAGTESGKETNTETRGESETGTGMKGQGGGQGQSTVLQCMNAYLGGLSAIYGIVHSQLSQGSVNSGRVSALTSSPGTSESVDRRGKRKATEGENDCISQLSNILSQRDGVTFMEILNKLFGEAQWKSCQDDLVNNSRSLDRSQVDHFLYLLVPSFVDQTLVRENFAFHGCDNIFVINSANWG